jgi:hypothetical protein
MFRTIGVALLAILGLVISALTLPMLPTSVTLNSGAALAGKVVQPTGLQMLNPATIIQMQKSRTKGPGLKVLPKNADAFCVSCHSGHKRNRTSRRRR